jgi:DNA protecting protein DprA
MITEASPILNLLLAKGIGTKTLSEIVDTIVADGLPHEGVGIDELADQLGLHKDLTINARAVQANANELAKELERESIQILVRGLGGYPQKLSRTLGQNAPPVLFVFGNLSLFGKTAVGFCGSRHASEKGIRVASESACQLAGKGVNVVSGYAKGVDLAAHCASLRAGGTTTIVLAEGILNYRAKREIKNLLNSDNHVVVSEYSPQLPWIARNAMQRNKTIIGLSDAMVCIESGTTGGTHAAAEATLKLSLPLFVADFAQPAESAAGNKDFIRRGAMPLRGNVSGKPNLSGIYSILGVTENSESDRQNGDTTMANKSRKYEIVASPVSAAITGALRTAAQLHPVIAPLGQAWTEYESYKTSRRIEELINNLAQELEEWKQKGNTANEPVQPPADFAELFERAVEKVRKEFDETMRAKYARLLARIVADGNQRGHATNVQLIESVDALSELDLRVLELFKGQEEKSMGDLKLQTLGLSGDVNSQIWQVASSLAKLESRGLLLNVSTHSGVVFVQNGLNKDTARWRETKYRILPIGKLLIESIFD